MRNRAIFKTRSPKTQLGNPVSVAKIAGMILEPSTACPNKNLQSLHAKFKILNESFESFEINLKYNITTRD